jgi:hypothetical protein
MLAEMLGDQADNLGLEYTGFDVGDLDQLLRDSGLLASRATDLFGPTEAGDSTSPDTGDEHRHTDDPDDAAAPGDWVVVSWTMRPAERADVRAAVRHLQNARPDLETSAAAALHIFREYLRANAPDHPLPASHKPEVRSA